jgi:hypothetical protein
LTAAAAGFGAGAAAAGFGDADIFGVMHDCCIYAH